MWAPKRPVATGTPSARSSAANASTSALADLGRSGAGEAGPVAAAHVGVERELRHDERLAADVERATGSCAPRRRRRRAAGPPCRPAGRASSGRRRRPPRRAPGGPRRSPPTGLRPPPRRPRSPAGSVLARAGASFSSGDSRVLHSRSFQSFESGRRGGPQPASFFALDRDSRCRYDRSNEQLQNEIEQMLHDRSPDVEVVLAERAAPGLVRVFIDHPGGRRHSTCASASAATWRRCASATRSRCRHPASSARWCVRTTTSAWSGRQVDVRTVEPIDGRRHFTARAASTPTTRASISSRTAGRVRIAYAAIRRGRLVFDSWGGRS